MTVVLLMNMTDRVYHRQALNVPRRASGSGPASTIGLRCSLTLGSFPGLVECCLLVSPLESNLQLDRLPQKSFSCIHVILLKLHIVPPHPGCYNHLQLHIRHVPPNASARPMAEGDEGVLLPFGDIFPSSRAEIICIWSPNLRRVVNAIRRHAEGSARWEPVAVDTESCGVRWYRPWKPDTRC